MIKKYLSYYFKKRIPIFVLLFFVFGLVFLISNRSNTIADGVENDNYWKYDTIFTVYTVCLCIAASIVPMAELSFKMRKLHSEQLYSLPIERHKLFWIHALFSYIEVVSAFTAAYFISWLSLLKLSNALNMQFFMVYYLFAILGAFLIVGVVSFIFTRANNVLDGIAFVAGYTLLFTLIVDGICLPANLYTTGFDCSLYSAMDRMTAWLNHVLVGRTYDIEHNAMVWSIIDAIVFGVGGILCWGLFILFSYKVQAEDITKKSDWILGYPVIIPVFGIFGQSLIGGSEIVLAIMIIMTYLATAFWRRNFLLKKNYWFYFGIVSVIEIGYLVLLKMLEV